MPQYPTNDGEGHHQYSINTYWEKLVADYLRISIIDVEDLDYFEYLEIRRDAFIHKLNQTEKGQEYLDNAYRLTLTKPDRAQLRNQFQKG